MYHFRKGNDLRNFLQNIRRNRKKIGFVPTMGALHKGHVALIKQSVLENDCTVCSIFVNPTQFNDRSDLKNYPRTEGRDLFMLCKSSCQIAFLPTVEEIYPKENQTEEKFDFGSLDKVMEGKYRPGHFAGVAQVVHRLMRIIRPDQLYMGQKDFQQLIIIRRMLDQLELPVELVVVPTVREANGLAMSSRNARLSPGGKTKASAIFDTLEYVRKNKTRIPPSRLEAKGTERLEKAGLKPEYVKIANAQTLEPLERFDDAEKAIVCVAAWLEDVRLIDNMLL